MIASVATDGTDGPTDAAGGIVDGKTMARLRKKGIDAEEVLNNNDSYHALEAVGDLLKTGPTGTNVSDLVVILCR
jgi:hydroxypyruvate reductase